MYQQFPVRRVPYPVSDTQTRVAIASPRPFELSPARNFDGIPQQKTLWAEVRKESGRGKGRFKVRDLLAYTRCSQPVLDFLSTDVGRRVPPPVENDA
jgi:hypothetical protein